jgi:hypothetical protein
MERYERKYQRLQGIKGMKLVVQSAPDPAELALSGLDKEAFVIDQDTYCHFRDEVLIRGMESFIKKIAPGKWTEADSPNDAEKVQVWFDNQRLIYKYYRRFKAGQKAFLLYENEIYFYKLIGFANVGNEIQLMRLDIEDVMELLNRSSYSLFKKLARKMRAYDSGNG